MMHLLLSLAGEAQNNNQGGASAGGVVESVFNNKIMNKIDYQPA